MINISVLGLSRYKEFLPLYGSRPSLCPIVCPCPCTDSWACWSSGDHSGQCGRGGRSTSAGWKRNRAEPDGRSNEGEEQKGKFPKDVPMALLHLPKDRRSEKGTAWLPDIWLSCTARDESAGLHHSGLGSREWMEQEVGQEHVIGFLFESRSPSLGTTVVCQS